MNSTPVIIHNISGAAVMADVRVPKGTRHISIIPIPPEVLANCALLAPTESEEIDDAFSDPFSAGLYWLNLWQINDDCPSLATMLDEMDHAGVGRSFDLKFWLRAWKGLPIMKDDRA
jgi:hypothetical protein